jgi:uncharacterized damage-inducible protein DinB
MTLLTLPRPTSDEADPSYLDTVIAVVPDEQIGRRLAAQLDEIDDLLQPLDDSAALARYAPGKWSIKEVLGHLIDTERVYTYRLLRISRGDRTPLPGFDENTYVPAGRFDARTLAALLAEFRAVRLSTIALIEGTAPEWWSLRGEANGKPFTARALAYVIVGHVAHHLTLLRERYGLTARPAI